VWSTNSSTVSLWVTPTPVEGVMAECTVIFLIDCTSICSGLVQVVPTLLCSSWQDFDWQIASRGPSAIAELLVHCWCSSLVNKSSHSRHLLLNASCANINIYYILDTCNEAMLQSLPKQKYKRTLENVSTLREANNMPRFLVQKQYNTSHKNDYFKYKLM